MDFATLGITVLWTFLYGYVVIASIDFGAGFYNFYAKLTNQDNIITPIINRYLNPVWEVTNVFFVFFFVGIVGFFPDSAYYFGTVLLIPASISLIMLAIRGSYYAFNQYSQGTNMVWTFLYGVTGLFIPASLSVALVIAEGGFIEETAAGLDLDYVELFFSGYTWSVVFLAVISVLYISSGFLLFYSNRAKAKQAVELTRTWFLTWTIPMLVISQFVFLELRAINREHFDNATQNYWYFFLCSIVFMAIAAYLVYKKKNYGVAFVMVMLQFAFAFFGYGISKLPYILYPFIKLDAVVNDSMAIALVIVFVLGLLLLIPSLIILMRLFLFDKDYVQGKE